MANESDRVIGSNLKELANPEARNALVTANGIVLGFEITFGAGWAQGEEPWEWQDLWFGFPFAISIILLIIALLKALLPYSQTVQRYETSSRILIWGLAWAVLAIFLSVLT